MKVLALLLFVCNALAETEQVAYRNIVNVFGATNAYEMMRPGSSRIKYRPSWNSYMYQPVAPPQWQYPGAYVGYQTAPMPEPYVPRREGTSADLAEILERPVVVIMKTSASCYTGYLAPRGLRSVATEKHTQPIHEALKLAPEKAAVLIRPTELRSIRDMGIADLEVKKIILPEEFKLSLLSHMDISNIPYLVIVSEDHFDTQDHDLVPVGNFEVTKNTIHYLRKTKTPTAKYVAHGALERFEPDIVE